MWEYQTHYVKRTAPKGNVMGVDIDKKYNEFMEQMGQQGWELTGVSPNMFMGTLQGDTLYFKRPLPRTDH